MSYDFFNVGVLAYGKKLAAVFDSLSSRIKNIDEIVDNLIVVLQYYDQYIGRNYKAPVPTRQDLPVRTNELFDLIGRGYQIKTLEYNTTDKKVHVELYYTHPDTHIITIAKGSTTLKEGYCYYVPAIWNNDMSKPVRFSSVDDRLPNEVFICKYRVGSDNIMRISNFGTPLSNCYPQDYSQVKDIAIGDNIPLRVDGSYTATEYECIVVKQPAPPFDWEYYQSGSYKEISAIKLNGTEVLWDNSRQCCNFQILYLKPNDKVTGTFEGFKIKYLNDRS